jgi:hypothetical protein
MKKILNLLFIVFTFNTAINASEVGGGSFWKNLNNNLSTFFKDKLTLKSPENHAWSWGNGDSIGNNDFHARLSRLQSIGGITDKSIWNKEVIDVAPKHNCKLQAAIFKYQISTTISYFCFLHKVLKNLKSENI